MAARKQSTGSSQSHDPERANKTQPRLPPPEAEDPELANSTRPRNKNPLNDPEARQKTQRKSRPSAPRRPSPEPLEDEEYHTGSNYEAQYQTGHDEDEPPPNVSLEGDGLDALDPEVGTRTRALSAAARPVDEQGDEDEGDEAPAEGDAEGDEANATRAGPPMKLEIFAGPDSGKKRRFKGVRMVIGRTPGVDLLLSDQSVSRRHVELIMGDGGVLLRDLGSGNGTKVNGEKVAEKKLEHGDEIAIGKTKLRFIDEIAAFKKAREEAEQAEAAARAEAEAEQAAAAEAAAAEAAEASSQENASTNMNLRPAGSQLEAAGASSEAENTQLRSRPVRGTAPGRPGAEPAAPGGWAALNPRLKKVIVAFVACALLIIVVGLVLRRPAQPKIDPAIAEADQRMQDARAAAKAGDYALAVKLVDEAEKLVPGIDKTHLLAQAQEELTFVRALDDAKLAITERRFEDARKALDRAGKGSGRNEEARTHLREDLETAEVAYKKEKIEEFVIAGEIEAAKRLVAELPVDQQQESAAKITEYERQLADQTARDAAAARARAGAAAAVAKAQRAEEVAAAFAAVERKFAGGEWDRAASECARVIDDHPGDPEIFGRARALQTDIPSFGRAYDEGMKKFRQGAIAQASKPLRQAWQLYGKINLRANKYPQDFQGKLVESAVAAGREALLRDQLVDAYSNYRAALALDADSGQARQGLLQVEGKAAELFERAYMERDSDPHTALRLFKIVVQVTESDSSVHVKAMNHIAALQP